MPSTRNIEGAVLNTRAQPGSADESHVLDRVALDRLRGLGGDQFLAEMVDAFLPFSEKLMAEARVGLCAGNLVPVVRMGHSLKSSALTFGSEPMRRLAVQIDECAREGRAELLPELLAAMDRIYSEVRACLVTVRDNGGKSP